MFKLRKLFPVRLRFRLFPIRLRFHLFRLRFHLFRLRFHLFTVAFLIISFIILLKIYSYYQLTKYIEPMTGSEYNDECNLNLKDKTSFCTWDVKNDKCKCVFQKDSLNTNFSVPNSCCPLDCGILTKGQCVARGQTGEESDQAYFYCPNKGVCEKLVAYQDANKISSNYCGYDTLTNDLIYPYLTSEECVNNLSTCSKYNEYTGNQKKVNCLDDSNCGWCTNAQGIGDCVEGTPSGPVNIYKYDFCLINSSNDNNKYSYSLPETFTLTEEEDD
jgi:hypothetical protein